MWDMIFPGVLFIGANLLAIMGMLLVRKNVRIATLESHHEVAGFIYAVVGLIYGVLIAFVVMVVWEQYNLADDRLGNEASIIASVYRDCEALPDSIEVQVKPMIVDYCKSMITHEFQAMKKGKTSQLTDSYYNRIWRYFYYYKPDESFSKTWHPHLLTQLNKFSESRRLRILSINSSIPAFMWSIIILGGILTIGYCYFFATKNVMSQLLMVVSLTSIICLVLILIYSLDFPFSGIIHVTPEPFINVLGAMSK